MKTRKQKLKVYGTYTHLRGVTGQVRAIVATTSQKKAAELLHVSLYDFRYFGCETGNPHEIETAMAEPGAVFWSTTGYPRNEYQKWEGC